MAKKLTWKSLGFPKASQKRWEDLGIGPEEFSVLRKISWECFRSGSKEESDRVWKLIKAGYTINKLMALAEDDSESSQLLGYLFALTKMNLEITPERLTRFEEIRESIDVFSGTDAAGWVELDLRSEDLERLRRFDLVENCDEKDLERVQTMFAKLRWETSAKSVQELLQLIETAVTRLGKTRVLDLVDSGEFASVVSDIQTADEEEAEKRRFLSGHYGDWVGLGISQFGMDFYMTHFFEHCDDAEFLVDELRFLLGLGFSHDDLYSKIQHGFKFSQIEAMREAGLSISRETMDEWDGVSDPNVILFFIDNSFSAEDRGDILLVWILKIDILEAWWDFCKKQDWTNSHTRAQLIHGVDSDDISTVPQITTLTGDVVAELLDLDTYLRWREFGEMHNKFSEIQRWRKGGFVLESRRFPASSYEGSTTSMYDPLGWRRLKFSASEAVRWIGAFKDLGYTTSPSLALAWKQAGVAPESVAEWVQIGVMASEAAAWIQSGVDVATAAARKKAGISPPL